jgi:hypothetical protein
MISQTSQIEALLTDWSKIPIEKTVEDIERQMVVGENVMMCRFRFAKIF